jgi:hypothetical protein
MDEELKDVSQSYNSLFCVGQIVCTAKYEQVFPYIVLYDFATDPIYM